MDKEKKVLMSEEGLEVLKRVLREAQDYPYFSTLYDMDQWKQDVAFLQNMIKANDILRIIFNAPSIINQLFELGELGKDATQRYFWGTISDADVKKVKEFFDE